MPKRSRLAVKNVRSGFRMVAAILFLPFENRTNMSSPDHLKSGLTSLDRFIKKRVIKIILFMPKRSRLVVFLLPFENRTNKYGPDHLKTGPFENRTQKVSAEWPFEYRTVWYSDAYCIYIFYAIK